jgi:hypothetical protein
MEHRSVEKYSKNKGEYLFIFIFNSVENTVQTLDGKDETGPEGSEGGAGRGRGRTD